MRAPCSGPFVLALALAAVVAQHTPAAAQAALPSYRGFAPALSYREFAERARALARRDPMACNTSRRTAQLMECGVLIRDPADSATFYLSAYILEGRVALLSFGDSGGTGLVERMQRELRDRFGPPRATGMGTWEWEFGRQTVRFNWRGRGPTRWIYLQLSDGAILDSISKYVKRR
jgi:hypothetical protein